MKSTIFITAILQTYVAAQAPGVIWSNTYDDACFYDVHATVAGNIIVAGQGFDGSSVMLFDPDGQLIWSAGGGFESEHAYWVEEVPGSGFIATGSCRSSAAPTWGLHLLKIGYNGELEWFKVYDIPGHTDSGYCVIPLPDGGYAICGTSRQQSPLIRRTWVLRTDSSGDTLWTHLSDGEINDRALRIVYEYEGLTILAKSQYLTHFDLNGNILWESYISGVYGCRDMCLASDFGYIVLNGYTYPADGPTVSHVDSLGNIQWTTSLYSYAEPHTCSINPTMDGGYIYAGYIYSEYDRDETIGRSSSWGTLSKIDSLGNEQWWDWVDDTHMFYSARQLPLGGYIAAGTISGDGFLSRYEPETGLETEGCADELEVRVFPIPFSRSLTVTSTLPLSDLMDISIYDLSGHVIADRNAEHLHFGEQSLVWSPCPSLPNGCYLIVLDSHGQRKVARTVLLR